MMILPRMSLPLSRTRVPSARSKISTAARTVDVEFVTPLPFFPTIVRVESDRPLVDAHAAVTAP